MKVCAYVSPDERCITLTDSAYCERHRKQRRRESARRRPDTPDQRAYKGVGSLGRRWRNDRKAYLRDHPWCECDNNECMEPSKQVHHRDGLGVNGPRGLDWSNFQALSRACHSRITAIEQPGGWHA